MYTLQQLTPADGRAMYDLLQRIGGNIAYAIDPLHRGRGCGKALLNLLLEEARRRGIGELLVTTYPDNTASRRVAESCGGVCRKVTEERVYYDFH